MLNLRFIHVTNILVLTMEQMRIITSDETLKRKWGSDSYRSYGINSSRECPRSKRGKVLIGRHGDWLEYNTPVSA